MSEKEMNLYQKIVAVRRSIGDLAKDKQGDRYSYVSGNQVLTKIEDKMNELNLLLIPSTLDGEYEPYTYKTRFGEKTDLIVKGKMTYTWINGDKPEETMEVPWFYFGQMSEISKAFGSALTYSERYFLLKSFGVPTDQDDPDGKKQEPDERPKKKQQKKKVEGQVLSDAQINRFYAIARAGGHTPQKANAALQLKYNLSDPAKLTRAQYDEVCNAMEAKKKGAKVPTKSEVDAVIDNKAPF